MRTEKMPKIKQFSKMNDETELTEYEKQVLREAQELPDVAGRHSDEVNSRILQDELRIRNGLEPKYDPRELLAESLLAAILDAEESGL